MSIEALKQELTALTPEEQRVVTAFLVSLPDTRDDLYRKKLADKINQPAKEFATLDDLDKRLKI